MPRIELTIDVRDDKIQVSHPEKGTLLDLQNTVLFEKKSRSLIGVGITKEQYFSEVPNHISEEDLSIDELISEGGITGRRSLAALYHLMFRSASIFRPDLYKVPLSGLVHFNLNLSIQNYSELSGDTREKFEFELANFTLISMFNINGRDFGYLVRRTKRIQLMRSVVKAVSLIPFIFGIFALIPLVSLTNRLFSEIVSFIVFMVLFIIGISLLGTFVIILREVVWYKLIEKTVPKAILLDQINQSRELPGWLKTRLIRSVK